MDPFLYALISLIALALGVTVGYLIGRNAVSGGGATRVLVQWPHVVIDPNAKHRTAAEMLEAIYFEAASPSGPADPQLRLDVMSRAVMCQYGHFLGAFHQYPLWDDPVDGAKGKVLRAYNFAFGNGVPQDWQLCSDELGHNP